MSVHGQTVARTLLGSGKNASQPSCLICSEDDIHDIILLSLDTDKAGLVGIFTTA